MNNAQPIQNESFEVGSTAVARVLDAHQGEAISVCLDGQEGAVPVVAHASEVDMLHADDAVVVMCVSDGAIVVHRLRVHGERPRVGVEVDDSGRFVLSSDKGICLQVNAVRFELCANGRVFIEGEEVYNVAHGVNHLYGAKISLN